MLAVVQDARFNFDFSGVGCPRHVGGSLCNSRQPEYSRVTMNPEGSFDKEV